MVLLQTVTITTNHTGNLNYTHTQTHTHTHTHTHTPHDKMESQTVMIIVTFVTDAVDQSCKCTLAESYVYR